MIISYSLIFIIFYLIFIILWRKKVKWRLSHSSSNTIKYLHYVLLAIIATLIVTWLQYAVDLRGLWSTRTIILLTLFTGLAGVHLFNQSTLNKFEALYFKFFSFTPVLAAIVLFIPFLGPVIIGSFFGQLLNPAEKIYYNDKNVRVQSSFTSVLMPPTIEIFEKFYIFEKHHDTPDLWYDEIDSVQVNYYEDFIKIFIYSDSNRRQFEIKRIGSN